LSASPARTRGESLLCFALMNFLWNAGIVSCTLIRTRIIPEPGAGIEEKR
jgi:hypothetical protein